MTEGPPDIQALYREHFRFVWRCLRRLGVPRAGMDDAVQEVFLVAHRRSADFEPGAEPRPWLFGIAFRIARQQRRKHWRERTDAQAPEPIATAPDPFASALQAESARRLQTMLDALDDDKRSVLILADLEQWSAPEIARALDANLNTVYARLRAARQQLAAMLQRQRARDDGGRHD